VPNGLAPCKLRHAAFDANLMGVRPDHRIEVKRRLLEEIDGPMLIHGLQGFDGQTITGPREPSCVPTGSSWRNATSCFGQPVEVCGSSIRSPRGRLPASCISRKAVHAMRANQSAAELRDDGMPAGGRTMRPKLGEHLRDALAGPDVSPS
jgi:hypothetical protein